MFNCILNAPTYPPSLLTFLPPWLIASLSSSWCFSLRIKSNGSSRARVDSFGKCTWLVFVVESLLLAPPSFPRCSTPLLPRYSRHLAARLIKRYFIAFWRLIMAKMGLETLMERQTEDGKGSHKTRGSRSERREGEGGQCTHKSVTNSLPRIKR